MGLIYNNKLIWDSGEIPDGTSLYDFNGKRLGLSGSYDLASGSGPNYQVVTKRGNSISLKSSINDCSNGISITFDTTSIIFDDNTSVSNNTYSNLSFSSNPIRVSKESLQNSTIVNDTSGGGSYSLTVKASDKTVYFSTDGKDGTLLDFYSIYQGGQMIVIKSIVSY
ncbi:hypothetical protein RA16_06715 [Levilactobacillus brevis]|uniref:hypothetical protein n=1 Tax=Levilactobacillus brevis TaxID=1580 RepID=UPI0005B632B9|nr:hypothetical protein [Levilactobacillus brevis]KIR08671.1 hypothetical protein RA16_06715 [Levilactobacillus brevis]